MLLLTNVFLTDVKHDRAVTHTDRKAYERYLLPNYNQVEIFKYSLASWAVLPLTKAIIFCKLDTNYAHLYGELEEFIRAEFACPVQFIRDRNETQAQWQTTIKEMVDDNIVYYMCNHDHVFLDSDLITANKLINRLEELGENAASFVSHWPEVLNAANVNGGQLLNGLIEFNWQTTSSVQFLTKDILYKWWFQKDYGDEFLPRPDWFFFTIDGVQAKFLTTCKEIFRHFDGYSLSSILPERCPPLSIPVGFFEKNIEIDFGGPGNNTRVSPVSTTYRATDSKGADIIGYLSDIPLFWQPRIKNINIQQFDDKEAQRNMGYKKIMTAMAKPEYENIPIDWIDL
jgi:hypothetical protein